MKMPTKVRYSVRFMIDLATHASSGAVLMRDICKRQEISEKYLGHFIPLLKNAGLIAATRGVNGGFVLTKEPKDITLRQIIEAVDGPTCFVGCVENAQQCKRSGGCVARDFWAEVTNKFIDILGAYKLSDLVEREAGDHSGWSYII